MAVIKNNDDINLKTASGIAIAGKVYLVWLGGVLKNVKSITAYALKQDWKATNKTVEEAEVQKEDKPTIWDRIKS